MTHSHAKPPVLALRVHAAALVRVLLTGVCLGLATTVQATGVGDFVVDNSRAADVDNCVEPTEYMRRNHMEVIRHQRDSTVYGGIRSTKHSLAGCVQCHVGYDAQQNPVAIDGKDQFCAACHSYAAVTVNCFDCHATVPEGEAWNHETAAAHLHRRQMPEAGAPRTAGVDHAALAESQDQ